MMNGTRRPLQPEDLYRFVTVPDAQIAPDGTRVAFVKNAIDAKADGYTTAIWLAPVDGGTGGAAPDRRGLGNRTGSPIQRRQRCRRPM